MLPHIHSVPSGYLSHDHSKEITEKKNDVLNALKKVYPNSQTAQEIATEYDMSYDTVNNSLNELADNKFIIRIGKRVSEIFSSKPARKSDAYVFENLNFALNEAKGFAFQFAPGSINYDKDFLRMYDEVILRRELDEAVCRPLLNFTTTIVERIMRQQHDITSVKKIAPKMSKDNICTRCGINHDVRDFIRALLLHILDDLEINPSFLKFMKEHEFIVNDTYNELLSLFTDREKGKQHKEKQYLMYLTKEKEPVTREQGRIGKKEREEIMLRVLSIEKDTGLNKVFFTATDIHGTMVVGDIDIAVGIPDGLTSETKIKLIIL